MNKFGAIHTQYIFIKIFILFNQINTILLAKNRAAFSQSATAVSGNILTRFFKLRKTNVPSENGKTLLFAHTHTHAPHIAVL